MPVKVDAKEKSQYKAPVVQDSDTQRAIDKVYEDLNSLKDATNIEIGTSSGEHEGKPGDIRLIQEHNNIHVLEIRTKDGWKRGKVGVSEVQYISTGSRTKYEPAHAVVTVNEETGEEEAEVTPPSTYVTAEDLNNMGFVTQEALAAMGFLTGTMPTLGGLGGLTTTQIQNMINTSTGAFMSTEPDYESNWTVIDRTSGSTRMRTFTHNLTFNSREGETSNRPSMFKVFLKDTEGDADGNAATNNIYPYKPFHSSHTWIGLEVVINDTNVRVRSDNNYYVFFVYSDSQWDGYNGHRMFNKMSVKVMLWK